MPRLDFNSKFQLEETTPSST
ncbi:hypothetical protein pipiens_000450, partial [Culex pipiens pipiens]